MGISIDYFFLCENRTFLCNSNGNRDYHCDTDLECLATMKLELPNLCNRLREVYSQHGRAHDVIIFLIRDEVFQQHSTVTLNIECTCFPVFSEVAAGELMERPNGRF